MKTFPALYIDPQGVICLRENGVDTPFRDQNAVKAVIKEIYGHDLDQMNINTKGYMYPLPKGYSIEILVKPVRVGFEKWDYVKVAVLTPIKNKKMKKWTETEIKRAKIRIRVEYKMGNLPVTSKEVILRPSRMEDGDIELFINLLETYGKSK